MAAVKPKEKKVSLIPLRERIRKFERGDVYCIKPHLCKAAQNRGVPAPIAVCYSCEVREKCKEKRYLSQTQMAQKSQVLCIAQAKLFINPLHRGFFRQISKGQPSDRVCVIDEAKAHELFVDCSLSKAVLQQWVKDWTGESLGKFAKEVLELLEVQSGSPYSVAELVDSLTDKEIQELSRQASRYRVPYRKSDRGATDKETQRLLSDYSVQFENGKFAYVSVDWEAYDILKDKGLSALQPQEVSERGYLTLTPRQGSLSVSTTLPI